MRTLSATLLTAALLGTLLVAAPATSTAVPAETCGTELRPADRERIVELSTYDQDSRDLPLVQLRRNVAKLYGIVDILTDRRDRRGLFALGLAAVERDAVMPLQNNPRVFQTPRWAPVISLELLNRFLDAVRGEFGGGPVAPQWRHYFDMADDCAVPGQRVAMAGYNSHITVDLAYATADARATPSKKTRATSSSSSTPLLRMGTRSSRKHCGSTASTWVRSSASTSSVRDSTGWSVPGARPGRCCAPPMWATTY